VLWLLPWAQGLLRLNTTSGQLEQLASRVHEDASPIAYANGLDIASDGSIYFTASTDILPARSRDGSYDTGFAWVLNNFRGLPRWVTGPLIVPLVAWR
jgi:sugar lactone lactonase YvrE